MAKLTDSRKRMAGREAAWAAIREPGLRGGFTVAALSKKTGTSERTLQDYVQGLEAAGYLRCVDQEPVPTGRAITPFRRKVYVLNRDIGLNAPRVRRDGTEIPSPGRERMWRAMRILKEFTLRELMQAASQGGPAVAEGEARTYCQALARGKYLTRIKTDHYRFMKARDTGGRAPQILRVKKLYDPNLGRVVWESKHSVEGGE